MKILFISHDASRTGAPILLINMLKWIKANTNISFDILLLNGGILENEFEQITKVFRLKAPYFRPIGLKKQMINRILKRKYIEPEKVYEIELFNLLQQQNYSVIYGNTIVSIFVFERIMQILPYSKYCIHVHELFSITKFYEKLINDLKDYPIEFIAVSEMVRHNLMQNHAIKSNISLVYEYIDIEKISQFNKHLKVNKYPNKFIINGSGLVQIRKGYDIFIMIAKRSVQKYPDIPFYFRWIGEIPSSILPYIDLDIKFAELQNCIEFTGDLKNPYNEYAISDLFILTSREDPFPLVCLEHACLGIPIVYFDKVSGIKEFVEEDAGVMVPYLDIETTVDIIAELYINKVKRQQLGDVAKMKVQKFDINIQVPKILEIIRNA